MSDCGTLSRFSGNQPAPRATVHNPTLRTYVECVSPFDGEVEIRLRAIVFSRLSRRHPPYLVMRHWNWIARILDAVKAAKGR